MAEAASSGAIPHEAEEEKRATAHAYAIKKTQSLVVFIKKTLQNAVYQGVSFMYYRKIRNCREQKQRVI